MSQFAEEPLNSTAQEGFGYFPAIPGQLLKQGRYKVSRKLGWGTRSSVWLAIDLQDDPTFYCVLKVLTAHATLEHSAGRSQELASLESIQSQATFNNLPLLYDHFTEASPNGDHLCIVTVNVLADIDKFRLSAPAASLHVHIVKKVIASIVNSLSCLHENDIIHGAVTPDNFMFGILSRAEDLEPLLSTLPPTKVEELTLTGVKYSIVHSQPIPHGHNWEDNRVRVADYVIRLNNLGHAQETGRNASWDKTTQDRSLRPPEVILQTDFNAKADIWMLGCATYLLLTGNKLFSSVEDDDHLARMSALTEESFDSATWKKSKRFGEFKNINVSGLNLEEELRSTSRLSEKDVNSAAAFICDCLRLDPSQRPSADDLISHSWLASGYACSCGYCMDD